MNQKHLSGKILAAPIAIGALVILIAVGGYLGYAIYQSKQIEEVETPIAIAEPSDTSSSSNTSSSSLPSEPSLPSTTDETADWQTYTDDQYGFSFKYPKDWQFSLAAVDMQAPFDSYDSLGIYSKTPREDQPEGGRSLQIKLYNTNQFSEAFIKQNNDKNKITQITKPKEIVNIAGVKASHITVPTDLGINDELIFFDQDIKKPIVISYLKDDSIHNQILSTFKFTP